MCETIKEYQKVIKRKLLWVLLQYLLKNSFKRTPNYLTSEFVSLWGQPSEYISDLVFSSSVIKKQIILMTHIPIKVICIIIKNFKLSTIHIFNLTIQCFSLKLNNNKMQMITMAIFEYGKTHGLPKFTSVAAQSSSAVLNAQMCMLLWEQHFF